MAEDDIYGNKERYERFLKRIEVITQQPNYGNQRYYCKNPANVKYFQKLIPYFEAKDLSYIRRYRVLYFLTLITYVLDKDLAECDRNDINIIAGALTVAVREFHTANKLVSYFVL